jgi:hypothetical protein
MGVHSIWVQLPACRAQQSLLTTPLGDRIKLMGGLGFNARVFSIRKEGGHFYAYD